MKRYPIDRNAGPADGDRPTIGAKGDDHCKHGEHRDGAVHSFARDQSQSGQIIDDALSTHDKGAVVALLDPLLAPHHTRKKKSVAEIVPEVGQGVDDEMNK